MNKQALLLGLSGLVTIWMASCNEDAFPVPADEVPLEVAVQRFTIPVYQTQWDSLITSGVDNLYFGSYQDPSLGRVTAQGYFQPSNGQIRGKIVSDSVTLLDSYINIAFDYFMGPSASVPITLTVRQLEDELPRTNHSRDDDYAISLDTVARATFTTRTFGQLIVIDSDTLYNQDSTQLLTAGYQFEKVPLTESFGQGFIEYLEQITADIPDTLSRRIVNLSFEELHAYTRGLVITAEAAGAPGQPAEVISRMNLNREVQALNIFEQMVPRRLTSLELNFAKKIEYTIPEVDSNGNPVIDPNTGDPVLIEVDQTDTLSMIIPFSLANNYSQFTADRTGTALSGFPLDQHVAQGMPAGDSVYLQAGVGTFIRADFSEAFNFLESLENAVLTQASLTVDQVTDTLGNILPPGAVGFVAASPRDNQFVIDATSSPAGIFGFSNEALLQQGFGSILAFPLQAKDQGDFHFQAAPTAYFATVTASLRDGSCENQAFCQPDMLIVPLNYFNSLGRFAMHRDGLTLEIFYTRLNSQ